MKPELYNASITEISSHKVRYKREAMQKLKLYKYEKYKDVETTMADLIVQAYNQSYTKPKKDNILVFTNIRVKRFLNISQKNASS